MQSAMGNGDQVPPRAGLRVGCAPWQHSVLWPVPLARGVTGVSAPLTAKVSANWGLDARQLAKHAKQIVPLSKYALKAIAAK